MRSRSTVGAAAVAAIVVLVIGAAVAPVGAASGTTAAGATPPTTTAPPTTAPPTTRPGSASAGGGAAGADLLTADRDQVRAEVSAIDARLRDAEAAAAAAQARVDAAETAASEAADRSEQASTAASTAAADVRSYAVEAFVRPPAQDALDAAELSEAKDAAYATGVLGIVAERRHRVVETMIAARAVAEQDRIAARDARDAARAELDTAQAQRSELQAARSSQARLAARLDDRLDAALAEAAALRTVDTRVADDLAAQEVALRTSGPASTAPTATTTRAGAVGPTSPTPGTTTSAPVTVPTPVTRPPTPTTTPPTTTPSPPPGLVTWADVVKVGGIWVHRSIESNVRGLLDAAKAAGINLSGGGYRDPSGQIAVRRSNCGTSDYAIYQMPASQCTPPTARPGTSMHERGLAMDLQSSGHLITSRSDPAFVWLAANAARFGFYNLPSEPWHWSTNGN